MSDLSHESNPASRRSHGDRRGRHVIHPDALGEFSYPLVRWFTLRVRCSHTAEELAQDVLLRALKNLTWFRDRDRLAAWLFGIARNRLTDHYRRRQRCPVQLVGDLGMEFE